MRVEADLTIVRNCGNLRVCFRLKLESWMLVAVQDPPVARFLVESGFEVVGIDFSENMLRLARESVPEAGFIKKDVAKLDFPADSFEGVIASYSIIHVPREKHFSLFDSFRRMLKPEGIMLVCMGPDEWEATDEYLGTTMFWSHYSPEKSLELVEGAGFQIVSDQILVRGGERHYWLLARNKKDF